jgi:hypothetical protein
MRKIVILFVALVVILGWFAQAKVEYRGAQYRDPFRDYLPKADLQKGKFQKQLGNIKVTGLIWDTDRPLAIINGKVCAIGDTVAGAKVIDINKKGVFLDFQGEIYMLRPK